MHFGMCDTQNGGKLSSFLFIKILCVGFRAVFMRIKDYFSLSNRFGASCYKSLSYQKNESKFVQKYDTNRFRALPRSEKFLRSFII